MRYLATVFSTATSSTAICNIALGLIGVDRIVDINGTSKVERDCKLIYDHARREVLEGYHWRFARKMVELARLSETPLFGFSFAYSLPADCIRPINLSDKDTPFRVVGDQLHCNLQEDVYLEYTFDNKDAATFTGKFITSLSHRMAAPLALTIKKDKKLSQEMWDYYNALLPTNEADDARSENFEENRSDPYVDARLR